MPETKTTATQKPEPHVFTPEHPEYPFLLYNHETRAMKAAKDEKEKGELEKEGFVEEPLPPVDPDSMTDKEIQDLQGLLTKAAKALGKLGELQAKANSKDQPNGKAAAPQHQDWTKPKK